MNTGVEFKFDAYPIIHEWIEQERTLLRLACTERPTNDGVDFMAAVELLLKYADGAGFYASDVQAAVESGVRDVTRRVIEKGRSDVSPLMYFGRHGTPRTPPHSVRVAKLEQRIAQEIFLTGKDARIALTQEFRPKPQSRARGEPPVREEWPETVGAVEDLLIDYVLWRFLKKALPSDEGENDPGETKDATSKEMALARQYVRDSFSWLPWDQQELTVNYPADWLL